MTTPIAGLTYVPAKVVHIYVNSIDQWENRPLYSVIIQYCHEHGAAGATVMRCVEGYGSHHELHTTRLWSLSENLPVRVEVIDRTDTIEPLLVGLAPMLQSAFVTVSDTQIVRVQ